MKFAQSSVVYFNNTLKYAIKNLHDIGYEGIEIWGGRPHMYKNDLDKQLHEIKHLLNAFDMKVCNFIPAQFRYPSILCSENEVVRKDSVQYIKTAVDNAIKIGSKSISLCPGMVAFDQDLTIGKNQLFKSFKDIEKYCENKDIILLIEPAHRFESNIILTIDDCIEFLNKLNSPKFGILLDTGHANINDEKFDEIIPKLKDLLFHIHIDDNNADFDAHLIPGEGNVDFKSLIKQLGNIEYKGFLSAELGTKYCDEPNKACIKTLDVLKKMLI